MNTDKQPSLPRRKRWLIVLVTLLALFQAGAALRTLQIPGDLAAQISLIPPLEVVASAFWAVAAAWVDWMLWKRRPDAVPKALWLMIGFSIYSFGRLLLFTRADYDRGRLPFLTLITAIIVLLLAAAALRRQRTKSEFNGDLTP